MAGVIGAGGFFVVDNWNSLPKCITEHSMEACFGKTEQKAQGDLGQGPETIRETAVNLKFDMTFGDVEVEMQYPKHDGHNAKVDWNVWSWQPWRMQWMPDVEGTRSVADTSFYAYYTACLEASPDYTQPIPVEGLPTTTTGIVGLTPQPQAIDVTQKHIPKTTADEHTFHVTLDTDPNGKINKVLITAGAIEPCFIRIPHERINGDPNGPDIQTRGDVDDSVEHTFDYIVGNLAELKIAADACPETLVDEKAVTDRAKDQVAGQLLRRNVNVQNIPMEMIITGQEASKQRRVNTYLAALGRVRDMTKSYGGNKEMALKINDPVIKQCGLSADKAKDAPHSINIKKD